MRDNVDQPQGCGARGREGVCARCKPDMHTCVAPLSRERVKEKERRRRQTDRGGREGGREEGRKGGRGRERE